MPYSSSDSRTECAEQVDFIWYDRFSVSRRLKNMKSITLYLILSVLLSAKLSLIDGAPPKDFHQLLQPMMDHFEEFKQKADRNDNLDGTISDLQKDIKLLKS